MACKEPEWLKSPNPGSLGYSAAMVMAVFEVALGFMGHYGVYLGLVEFMQKVQILFSPTPLGILTGMIEASLAGFVIAYFFAWVYNSIDR